MIPLFYGFIKTLLETVLFKVQVWIYFLQINQPAVSKIKIVYLLKVQKPSLWYLTPH